MTFVLSNRTRVSLSQYFALQGKDWVKVLFKKHGIETSGLDEAEQIHLHLGYLPLIQQCLGEADPANVEAILAEVVRTQGNFRNRVSPRYLYDERFEDLKVCLQLDGLVIDGKRLYQTEPCLDGTIAVEDDLSRELQRSGLADSADVEQRLRQSAEDFRQSPADFNGALTNARVALQTLATGISRTHHRSRPSGFDETKWGQVIAHLRTAGVITTEEEKGLAGVFNFVSPGAHTPVGMSDAEMVRLGRSFIIGMCYFLIKRHNG